MAAALATASETPRIAFAPSRALLGVPSSPIRVSSILACASASMPPSASKISPLTAATALVTPLPTSPRQAVLDRVPNPHPDTDYVARFTAPEFTALCPITGQPDFAHLVIDYVPGKWLVESKSLKLYLGSFRNHGAFHEDCTVAIGKKLVGLLKPKWLRIGGYWYPRGAMPIGPAAKTSAARVVLRPPMASTGTRAAAAISARPLWPISGP